jgi:hypothetical protein
MVLSAAEGEEINRTHGERSHEHTELGEEIPTLLEMRTRALILLIALSIVATACGGGGDSSSPTTTTTAPTDVAPFGVDAFSFVASSNLAVGTERVLVTVSDDTGRRLPSPDIPVTINTWLDGREFQVQSAEGIFLWAIPDVSGLYRATFEFDVPGTWVFQIVPDGAEPLDATAVTVYEEPFTPAVGDPAPRSETLTSDDAPISEISSDSDPEPSFYEMTIAEAVTSGSPSVIVFATPRFCTTAICQPTLELMRGIAPSYPDVNFLHVEVFTNINDPDDIELAPAVEEWGLPTEPWVFVVDENGIVIGRYEGVMTVEELEEVLG